MKNSLQVLWLECLKLVFASEKWYNSKVISYGNSIGKGVRLWLIRQDS